MSGDGLILEVEKVAVEFSEAGGLPFLRRRTGIVRAVDGVTLTLRAGETVGIVGESGSGKTTLARALLGLVPPTEGSIRYKGRNLQTLRGPDLRWFRREVQMVFQDPYESLNPAFTIARAIEEPLLILGERGPSQRREIVRALLARVGLTPPEDYLARYPHELSGGQRQRVAIARALVVGPSLLIADEPVSMLDVSIRAGIMTLLEDLVRERTLACVYISHDLGLVRYLCGRTLVMYKGLVVEEAPTEQVIQRPRHPYTAALIGAAPTVERGAQGELAVLPRDRTDVAHPACCFYPRCPMAFEACKGVEPALEGGDGHLVRCHLFGPLAGGRVS